MCRQSPLLVILMTAAVVLSGCHPQQPFYLMEDGDLSHYLDVATEMEFPDVEEDTLDEVRQAHRPFSLTNREPEEIWDLELENAIQIALANSKVMRSIGGQVLGEPDFLARSPDAVPTVYDPAIIESNPRSGIEAALSAFDTQLSANAFWEKIDQPRNSFAGVGLESFFPRISQGDTGSFQARLTKTAATGGTWQLTHNVEYDAQNVTRLFTSNWNVNLEAEFRQPLLQGAGVQYNRIAGPGAIPGFNNGVMIARINTDVALADFELGVQNLVSDVEVAYWELYFAYRNLHAVIAGRDSGLQTWRQAYAEYVTGKGEAHEEARARQQYFSFRSAMEQALNSLYATERKLRYMLGLASTDGRLIRPLTEPKLAEWKVDWDEAQGDALAGRAELRRQRWQVKRRELEMISAKNYLLPRLDAVGRYRWVGMGDDLLDPDGTADPFDDAYGSLTSGNFAEWHLGLNLEIPLGFRKEMAGVRHAQLNLARERAKLQDQELEVSHQLAFAISELEAALVLTRTNFNRRVAARNEVTTATVKYEAGLQAWTLDQVLDAQRRLAEAESDYYRSLVDYNKAIANVHYRKGTLLEYNAVYLTEGPWPGKAYFDAHRRARARDASFYLDYGFTRPKVVSRGPVEQNADGGPIMLDDGTIIYEGDEQGLEVIPTPAPVLADPTKQHPPEPTAPKPAPDPPASRSKTSGPPVAAKSYDLGSMDLGLLGGRRSGEDVSAPQWEPAVQAAGHQQPVDAPDRLPEKDTARSQDGWSSNTRSGTRHATVANPSAAETHWTAAGGSGL
ncbi:MAG TPA: TolC family protein [Thermoguttaceae bacterium]|nr:TolC family protein [Thermoguttaceae bacterium]